jgi:phosphoribosyl-dephospho-CoA transferase
MAPVPEKLVESIRLVREKGEEAAIILAVPGTLLESTMADLEKWVALKSSKLERILLTLPQLYRQTYV